MNKKKEWLTMASYVQYLNVGFGIFNNTREIESWSIEASMEEALMLDDPDTDIRIIGFRFFDMDPTTNALVKQSGIFYLSGEKITDPKNDSEISNYFKRAGREMPNYKTIIKITTPYFLVYPFQDGDRILDTTAVMARINAKKGQDRLAKIRKGIEEYKAAIVEDLRQIANAVEDNSFHLIPLQESDTSSEVKYLNIMNDGGNFNKHIDYLRKQRVELLNMENAVKENS